jgi:hypothetical protein
MLFSTLKNTLDEKDFAMMALIFFLIALDAIFLWWGKHGYTIGLMLLTLIISIFWFSHHITSALSLNL